ncbi:hypothetical protein D3C83_216850 [compost metagenome]
MVLVGGRAAGVWDSRRTAKGLAITIDPFDRSSTADRAAMAIAAERVGAAVGLDVRVDFGRVFTEKGRKLVIEPGDA